MSTLGTTVSTTDIATTADLSTHAGAADPHTVYQLESGLAAAITATKIDDLTAGDDNTDLNATTGVHGLLPKLGGGSTNFLRADGTWNAPGGASIPAEGRSKNAFDTALTAPGIDFASVGTLALAAAQTYYYPIYVASSITLDRIVCEVTTAGAASKLIQLGIYNADVDWQPTSLVLDAGTVTADSIAVKTITISQVLAAGRYLLAANTDGTPTLRAYRSMARFMGFLSTMGTAPFFSRASIASQTIIGTGFPSTGVVWSNYSGSSVGFDYTVFVRVLTP